MLREASKSATLDEPGYANRRAASALYVRAGISGNSMVSLHPNCSGAQSHCLLRRATAFASLWNKGRMQLDAMHVPSPYQQRIGRVRSTLIAVPATFNDQAQIIFARKIHRSSNIIGISCCDSVNTWLCGPCVNPTQSLREAGLVPDVVGVFQTFQNFLAIGTRGARSDRKIYGKQIPTDRVVEPFPRFFGGPPFVRGTLAAECGAREYRARGEGKDSGCAAFLQKGSSLHIHRPKTGASSMSTVEFLHSSRHPNRGHIQP